MSGDGQESAIERPVLILGLLGFSPEEEQSIGRAVEEHASSHVWWQLGDMVQADAWWVSGTRSRPLDDGSISILPGTPDGQEVRIALDDRPLAIAEPVQSHQLSSAYRFNFGSESSMWECLSAMESRSLLPTAAQLWLAARIVADDPQLRSRVHHVVRFDELLAIVDRVGEVGVLPGIGPADLESARWIPRPSSTALIPDHFSRTTFSNLVWRYALRTSEDLLPRRYRSGFIHFRRPPKVAQQLLTDDHLLVMRELSRGPTTFNKLQHDTGLDIGRLTPVLAALYLTGSITSNPARVEESRRRAQSGDPRPTEWQATKLSDVRDATVPAMLPKTLPSPLGEKKT